jgi:hypothetical protein
MFNIFINTYLQIFYACFPHKKRKSKKNPPSASGYLLELKLFAKGKENCTF